MQSTLAQTANLPGTVKRRQNSWLVVSKGSGASSPPSGAVVWALRTTLSHYAGCGWTDAVKRQMTNDIASMHATPHS